MKNPILSNIKNDNVGIILTGMIGGGLLGFALDGFIAIIIGCIFGTIIAMLYILEERREIVTKS
ncbi:MAG: hypothetical protein ABOK23_03055 [Candidatus Methanoperedens sp.]|nr:hypothetical protein [Candidatus Methanoperedens sp.]